MDLPDEAAFGALRFRGIPSAFSGFESPLAVVFGEHGAHLLYGIVKICATSWLFVAGE